jgi:hypothetical protein
MDVLVAGGDTGTLVPPGAVVGPIATLHQHLGIGRVDEQGAGRRAAALLAGRILVAGGTDAGAALNT